MAVSNNFLPKFDISENLSNDLRNIEKAKALASGWYKGNFDFHARKANLIRMIDGKEYYTGIVINSNSKDFYTEGTKGYYIAELLRLFGLENEDLDQLTKVWKDDATDGLYLRWRAKDEMSKGLFEEYVSRLNEALSVVDTIEVEYESQRYKTSEYPLATDRPYNTKQSIYGDRLSWGAIQKTYSSESWTLDDRILTLENIQTKPQELSFGKSIKFISSGTDITSMMDSKVVFAVQSMITYSGIDFMDRLSYSKIGETSYTVQQYPYPIGDTANYTSAIGKEIYDANIKSSFLIDEDSVHFKKYTGLGDTEVGFSEHPEIEDGRVPLKNTFYNSYGNTFYMTNSFWDFTQYSESAYGIKEQVRIGDEFLFKDIGEKSALIDVQEFRKLSIEKVGFYIGNYFNIEVSQDSGTWFDGFIGFLAKLLGKLVDLSFNILNSIPAWKLSFQLMTWVVNKIFNSDLSEKELFRISIQLTWVVIGAIFAPVTMGESLAISLGIALGVSGSEAEDKQEQAQREAKQKERLDKERQEDKKKKDEEELRKQNISSDQKKSIDDMDKFLKNPLYELEDEKNKLKKEMNQQFKLL